MFKLARRTMARSACFALMLILTVSPAVANDPVVQLDNGATGYLVAFEEPIFAEGREIEVVYDFDGRQPSDDALAPVAIEICKRDLAHIRGAYKRSEGVDLEAITMRFRWKTYAEGGGWLQAQLLYEAARTAM